jgi:hypothetical protein
MSALLILSLGSGGNQHKNPRGRAEHGEKRNKDRSERQQEGSKGQHQAERRQTDVQVLIGGKSASFNPIGQKTLH